MLCCCGTHAPSPSQAFPARQPVSILSSRAGPHSSRALWAAREVATHWFHAHRHRSHSASSAASAVDDTRSR
ncbi:hypothetical protein FR742_17065 [Nonomuraea sp. C10]|nr:hypothetical protein FR742_17065 [Nonomuraea sp. C10]